MSYKRTKYCYTTLRNVENATHTTFYACRRNGRRCCAGFQLGFGGFLFGWVGLLVSFPMESEVFISH